MVVTAEQQERGPDKQGRTPADHVALITAELREREAYGITRKPIDPSKPR